MLNRIGGGLTGEGTNESRKNALNGKINGGPPAGLHLNQSTGLCADRELVKKAVHVLKLQGITGDPTIDTKKRKQNKLANKKYKGLLKQASEWSSSLQTIDSMLAALDSSILNADDKLASETMIRVQTFLENKYKTKAKFAKVAFSKSTVQANKVEASVLMQRQLAKNRLKKHKSAVRKHIVKPKVFKVDPNITPVRTRKYSMKPNNTRKESIIALSRSSTVSNVSNLVFRQNSNQSLLTTIEQNDDNNNNKAIVPQQLNIGNLRKKSFARRTSQINTRTRFYSSVTEDSIPPPLPAMPELINKRSSIKSNISSSALNNSNNNNNNNDNTVEKIHTIDIDNASALDDIIMEEIKCLGCNKIVVDDFETIEKFDGLFHVDCFKCDNCKIPIAKQQKSDDFAIFFDDPELRLFCSEQCREDMLDRYGNNMCPGCMCIFVAGENVVDVCGRLYHEKHVKCFSCNDRIGLGTSKEYYFESNSWPFCESCYTNRFQKCNKCNQPIKDSDDAIDALGHAYHRSHFGCFKCGETFKDGKYYVDGKGDQARAYCEKHYLSLFDPRISCVFCEKHITAKENAIEFNNKIYHKKCFSCSKCKTKLKEGDIHEGLGKPYCNDCYLEEFALTCTHCNLPIEGDILMAGDDNDIPYHPDCFICIHDDCDGAIIGNYYIVDERPICEQHYVEQYAKKCNSCHLGINSEAVKALDKDYHKECLVCHICSNQLIKDNKLELFEGPDHNLYCDNHQYGQCAFDECNKPAWTDDAVFQSTTNGNYYCKEHLAVVDVNENSDLCSRCYKPIGAYGVSALGKQYHGDCFTCTICNHEFGDGEKFLVLEDEPVHESCIK